MQNARGASGGNGSEARSSNGGEVLSRFVGLRWGSAGKDRASWSPHDVSLEASAANGVAGDFALRQLCEAALVTSWGLEVVTRGNRGPVSGWGGGEARPV